MSAICGMCARGTLYFCRNVAFKGIKTEHKSSTLIIQQLRQYHKDFHSIVSICSSRNASVLSDRSNVNVKVTSRCSHIAKLSSPLIGASYLGRHYSTPKGTGGIADEILKARVGYDPKAEEEPAKKEEQEKEKKKKDRKNYFTGPDAWKLGLASLIGMSSLISGQLLFMWGAPAIDDEGLEVLDEYSELPKLKAYFLRALNEAFVFKKMIIEPSSQKLLPDPVKEPYYQPPYTLVLEMTDVLVHPDWTLNTGWRFKKRPGIDLFLQQVGPPLYEVVIYTREQAMFAFPIIDGLDPNGFVSYRLFRDATRYHDGTHIKDLSCLNRDLSRVIIVDCDPKAYSMHPRNAFGLKKWDGADEDRTLIDLAAFLQTVATSGVEDVRTVLDHYNQFEEPLTVFKENQIRLLEETRRMAEMKQEKEKSGSLLKSLSMGVTGRKR